MRAEISAVWNKIQRMINDFIVMLPNMVLALIVFASLFLQNFLDGILILLTEPFRIDDQIVLKNFERTVENIETRATTN